MHALNFNTRSEASVHDFVIVSPRFKSRRKKECRRLRLAKHQGLANVEIFVNDSE